MKKHNVSDGISVLDITSKDLQSWGVGNIPLRKIKMSQVAGCMYSDMDVSGWERHGSPSDDVDNFIPKKIKEYDFRSREWVVKDNPLVIRNFDFAKLTRDEMSILCTTHTARGKVVLSEAKLNRMLFFQAIVRGDVPVGSDYRMSSMAVRYSKDKELANAWAKVNLERQKWVRENVADLMKLSQYEQLKRERDEAIKMLIKARAEIYRLSCFCGRLTTILLTEGERMGNIRSEIEQSFPWITKNKLRGDGD